MKNRQIILTARPERLPKESDFRLIETERPQPGEGQFLVRTKFLSVDPYMRGRISELKSYAEPVAIGDVMVGGTVLESKHRRYGPGDVVVERCVSARQDRHENPKLSSAPAVFLKPDRRVSFGLVPKLTLCRGRRDPRQPPGGIQRRATLTWHKRSTRIWLRSTAGYRGLLATAVAMRENTATTPHERRSNRDGTAVSGSEIFSCPQWGNKRYVAVWSDRKITASRCRTSSGSRSGRSQRAAAS